MNQRRSGENQTNASQRPRIPKMACEMRTALMSFLGILAYQARKALVSFATRPVMCHQLPYMVRQRSSSQRYNRHLASSICCVKCSEICLNFTHESRRVIKNRWPLFDCITTSPLQWRQRETVAWLVLCGCPEPLLVGREQLPKRD